MSTPMPMARKKKAASEPLTSLSTWTAQCQPFCGKHAVLPDIRRLVGIPWASAWACKLAVVVLWSARERTVNQP